MNINEGNNLFYIEDNDHKVIAELSYIPKDENTIIIDHVFVSNTLRGKGIGNQLVDKAVQYAREKNVKVIPSCSFAHKIMCENDAYKDVLK